MDDESNGATPLAAPTCADVTNVKLRAIEPSYAVPLIVKAFATLLAFEAVPVTSPTIPPLNVCTNVQVFAVLNNGIVAPLVPIL